MQHDFKDRSTFDDDFELNNSGKFLNCKLPNQNFCTLQYGSPLYTKIRCNAFSLRILSIHDEESDIDTKSLRQAFNNTQTIKMYEPFVFNDVLDKNTKEELIDKILNDTKQEFIEKTKLDEERFRKKERITEEMHNQEVKEAEKNRVKQEEDMKMIYENKQSFEDNLNDICNKDLNTNVLSKRFLADYKSNYQYAVISIAFGYTNCLGIVHGAFSTEDKAIQYLTDVTQHKHYYLNNFVVPLYEFGNVEVSTHTSIQRKAKRVYRYKVLQEKYEQDLLHEKHLNQIKSNKEFQVVEKKNLTSS